MPYVNNNGVNIHYHVEGDGPPLVLHTGSPAVSETGTPMATSSR